LATQLNDDSLVLLLLLVQDRPGAANFDADGRHEMRTNTLPGQCAVILLAYLSRLEKKSEFCIAD